MARLAGAGCPHGTRHARRGRLHQCPDRRTAALPPFRRGARLVAGLYRPALGAGHASFLLGGGFHADGRPALQSGVGLSGRAGAQFARAARDAAAPRRRLRRAALGGGLALAPPRGRSGRRALQHARLVRRPHPDARQLPLPAELHGRSRNRAGVAHARPALYADRLGRADSPQPDAGRSCGLCARRPGGAARASLPRRRLFGPHGLPPDAPLRGVAAQRPNPFLPADARPARGRLRDGYRPLPGGRRHVQQPAPERSAPSRPHDPRGRPLRLRLCDPFARNPGAVLRRIPLRPFPLRSLRRAGRRRRPAAGVLREGALPRGALLRTFAHGPFRPVAAEGARRLVLLPAQLPRGRRHGRSRTAALRSAFLPAFLQQPHRR